MEGRLPPPVTDLGGAADASPRVHGRVNARNRQDRLSRPLLGPLGLERVTGIEPALSAWEAEVLPLNYIRVRHPLDAR